ncbi:sugar phosphate nucleotidyltransferase [Ruegeria marina]|uniref:Glucose-1-phosphate cytidylyltransferase n=1 Tax=Ruegeria marina TaxID=639004 RepID=A0A1G6VLZ5_9RHOB|nr:sugar phosphate nucleotidyltransferase [Ruegeria marina]SDD53866.1 glucose-1-phosphate cytidylyltransferase [Ruegeria marina]
MNDPAEQDIPVVILCGGEGTRFGQATQGLPKPLLEIGAEPILVHIMRLYAQQGFRRFILCLGYRGTMIKEYFLDRDIRESDLRLDLSAGKREYLGGADRLDWDITFAETGPKTQTGARVRRVKQYIDTPRFMLTYGDGVADIDLRALLMFHMAHGKIGTISGVQATSQFGELAIDGDTVLDFVEKPKVQALINGGFFVFERRFLDYIPDDPECILEREPLERLAAERELRVRRHSGYWQCMDTFKDYLLLNEIFANGDAPWTRPQ